MLVDTFVNMPQQNIHDSMVVCNVQEGDMHMLAARFEKAMVGTEWAISHPDCRDRLRKHYSHCHVHVTRRVTCTWLLLGLALEGCLGSERVYDNR